MDGSVEFDREMYLEWKAGWAKHGKTPWDVLEMVRPYCTAEYLDVLEKLIREQEGLK